MPYASLDHSRAAEPHASRHRLPERRRNLRRRPAQRLPNLPLVLGAYVRPEPSKRRDAHRQRPRVPRLRLRILTNLRGCGSRGGGGGVAELGREAFHQRHAQSAGGIRQLRARVLHGKRRVVHLGSKLGNLTLDATDRLLRAARVDVPPLRRRAVGIRRGTCRLRLSRVHLPLHRIGSPLAVLAIRRDCFHGEARDVPGVRGSPRDAA
mmetsp:Transcript_6342/g.28656  ORF Transcript_6342/g.28656 Transcript_6342/m.28656 type:complete len:208 (+) Transcript_6342:125-748(+)